MSKILLPAEAPLDLYKAAFIFYKKYNLNFCDFLFIYPNKPFTVRNNDILLGVNIEVNEKVVKLNSLEEAVSYLGASDEFEFLFSIPDSVLLGFSVKDKTLTLIRLFEFFSTYYRNLVRNTPLTELLDKIDIVKYNNLKISIQKDGHFISPEERLVLFKSPGVDFCIFYSNGTVGIQKNLIRKKTPLLTQLSLKKYLPTEYNWFIHRRGHLLVSKSNVKEDMIDVVREALIKALKDFKQDKEETYEG